MAAALVIRDLTKTYRNGVTALKGIQLEVQEGDFFALLGPNGAGKSTTIGIVSALINKTSGRISIFGHDLNTELSQAKASLGVVPQEFNFNVFEPVIEILVNQAGYFGIPRKQAYNTAETHLHRLGLWEKRNTQARQLSGGMKRRLMIARALVHQPRLLILDEPTAGVDIEIRRATWRFLSELNTEGTTIILTTHYLEEAETLCRHLAIINAGEIITNTPMRGLLDTLHQEKLVLYLKKPLARLPEDMDYDLRLLDPQTLEVTIAKEHNLNNLFAQLSYFGIEVISMRNKTNRLEELFLQLVASPN